MYYYDDELIRTTDVSLISGLGKHPIRVILDLSIDTLFTHAPGAGGNTVFPGYFQVNYLKIWQQKTTCGTAEVFCGTAFNNNTYNHAVKKSISLGGSGCTASSINTSDNVAFWATDYVIIGEGTTVTPNGSGVFSAEITLCPN
jgi:3D (Asp-Asp-Asp) domain-containing protein